VACILSIRTRDAVSLVAARRLFNVAPKPGDLARLTHQQIDRMIGDTTFHEAKAAQVQGIARPPRLA
jgi:endonuclease-3